MRPGQWAKNLFVLAALVFGRQLSEPGVVARALLAVAAFCLASSTVYLINDLRDREEDRRHPLKRLRPIAAGTLGVSAAVTAAVLLGGSAFAIGFALSLRFLLILASYLVLNVLAGAEATHVEVSRWLFLCTIFLALFLAFSKRRHEITLLAGAAAEQRKVLDHYSPAFLDQMINVVTASSVVAYALYCVAPETVEKYHTQDLVYTIPLVLYGIFRYLYLMYQSPGARNPTEAILRDPPFLINMVLWGLAVLWIVYSGGIGRALGTLGRS
jgi:4-hydroxybenzoate polyprenyltransferase